jgi:3-hydroxyacyl-[acyl-carrier-protein] dehydratase
MTLDKDAILALIPHRPPFLWVDRVVELEPGARCVGVKRVDPAEPFFAGHFPEKAVLPGVFLIEAAAQTAGVMLAVPGAAQTGERLLAAVTRFKFLKPVGPGTELRIETRVISGVGAMAYVEATISVAGETVARGELSLYSA